METIRHIFKKHQAILTLAIVMVLTGISLPAKAETVTETVTQYNALAVSPPNGGHTASEAVEYVRSFIGTQLDVDNGPLRNPYQCVDVVQAYYLFLNQTPAYVDGGDYAKVELPYGWRRYRYTKGLKVKPGDIVYLVNNTEGHVAVVTEVSATRYKAVNQNLNQHPYCEEVELPLGNSMTGIIRPNFGTAFTSDAPIVLAQQIKLDKTKVSMGVSDTVSINATVEPSATTLNGVIWTSSNPDIAKVYKTLKSDVIIANRYGTVSLTARSVDGYAKATCVVTVGAKTRTATATSVKLDKRKVTLEAGSNYNLTPKLIPANTAESTVLYWKSANPNVAKVNANGRVTAVNPGSTIISVSLGGGKSSASCEVVVNAPAQATSLTLNKSAITLNNGSTFYLQASLLPKAAETKKVRWVSSNTKVITVNSNGVIRAVGAGKARITAIVSGQKKPVSDYCDVIVKDKASVKLSSTKLSLEQGYNYKLEATVTVPKATDSSEIIWSSSDKNIVKVDQTGLMHCVSPGKATVTATISGGAARATCEVTVK